MIAGNDIIRGRRAEHGKLPVFRVPRALHDPARPEIQRQLRRDLPVVLKINAVHVFARQPACRGNCGAVRTDGTEHERCQTDTASVRNRRGSAAGQSGRAVEAERPARAPDTPLILPHMQPVVSEFEAVLVLDPAEIVLECEIFRHVLARSADAQRKPAWQFRSQNVRNAEQLRGIRVLVRTRHFIDEPVISELHFIHQRRRENLRCAKRRRVVASMHDCTRLLSKIGFEICGFGLRW